MDNCHCRYGFVSSYNETVFIHRTQNLVFEVSPAISHTEVSGAVAASGIPDVSVREAFLFFAKLSIHPERHRFPVQVGKEALVSCAMAYRIKFVLIKVYR